LTRSERAAKQMEDRGMRITFTLIKKNYLARF
jgi:hypothetical protein